MESKTKYNGDFSKSLFSIQLQLNCLLEEAGGESALELLDALCTLNKSEQRLVLSIFKKTIKKLASEEERLCTKEDAELKNFEEELYDGVMKSIKAKLIETKTGRRFAILDGGKSQKEENPADKDPDLIDFEKERAARLSTTKPVVN